MVVVVIVASLSGKGAQTHRKEAIKPTSNKRREALDVAGWRCGVLLWRSTNLLVVL